MTRSTPFLTLNNGVQMPALGLGVLNAGEETVGAVETALQMGYRLVDTAAAYFNEEQVGEGLRRSGIKRSDIFVTTKLWISDYGYDETLHAFDRSLRKLGLEQLDLYLLHWPMPMAFEKTVASWKAATRLLAEGRTRAIGVCNFSTQHLDALAIQSDVVPAVNQVELHPYFTQDALREANRQRGIVTEAWSPSGGVNRYWDSAKALSDPLKNQTLNEIANRYEKTAAQIALRWHIEIGNCVIPKSVNAGRIQENINIFDFTLSAEDISAISALNTGYRGGPDPEHVDMNSFNLIVKD